MASDFDLAIHTAEKLIDPVTRPTEPIAGAIKQLRELRIARVGDERLFGLKIIRPIAAGKAATQDDKLAFRRVVIDHALMHEMDTGPGQRTPHRNARRSGQLAWHTIGMRDDGCLGRSIDV